MVTRRMEGRVEELEKHYKNLAKKVATMAEKLVQFEALSTSRFDKIDGNLYKIRDLLTKDIKGKETEIVSTPTIAHSQAPFQPEKCCHRRKF